MSLTLQPGNSFTITRQIGNHTDPGTNFVQAVIRNAYTDTIIATVQLTDKGSQRFKNDWQVPADSSGQGFYISIVTSVYDSSAYSTKNPNYGDEENTYLVQDRVLRGLGGSGGIDSATLRRIVREELDKLDIPEAIDYSRIPEPTEFTDRTGEILKAISDNKPEPQTPMDFAPLNARFDELKQAIVDKEVTQPTDLAPLVEEIRSAQDNKEVTDDEMKSLLDALEGKLIETIKASVTQAIKNANFVTSFITHATEKPAPKSPVKEPEMADVSQLAL